MSVELVELAPVLAASAAVLSYIELRVTRAIERQSYLLEQRHHDRRRQQVRRPAYGRRESDRELPEGADGEN
jgi:hypothetical protein